MCIHSTNEGLTFNFRSYKSLLNHFLFYYIFTHISKFLAYLPNHLLILIEYEVLPHVYTHNMWLNLKFHNHGSLIIHFSYFVIVLHVSNKFLI